MTSNQHMIAGVGPLCDILDVSTIARQKREEEAFRASPAGQVLARHWKLSEELSVLPAAEQAPIARELVAIAAETYGAWLDLERMRDRHHRALGWAPVPIPPGEHRGFERLAIDAERAGRFDDAIALAEEAKRQGWRGSWDARIARCRRKAAQADTP